MKVMFEIGIYGGTFAPPHKGHVHAAEAFVSELSLDSLYVIPTAIPPHKELDFHDNPMDRLNMAKLAFGHIPNVVVSDYEILNEGKSYTYKTLQNFHSLGNLTFLCGTDMFLTLESWRFPEIIFSLAKIAVMPREDEKKDLYAINESAERYRAEYGAETIILNTPALPLSSTSIRRAIRSGEDISDDVSECVEKYIYENRLYSS